MFAFPTRQDALNVRDACARGDKDEADRLYDQSFHNGKWGFPGEDSEQCAAFEKQEVKVDKMIREWQKEWLAAAAENGHALVLRWLENWMEDEDDAVFQHSEDEQYSFEQRMAKFHLDKMCCPNGTVDDALKACTRWWRRIGDDENNDEAYPYVKRMCWGLANDYDAGERRMQRRMVDPELTPVFLTTHPKPVLFKYSTPDYVIDVLNVDSCCIVGYIIREALRSFLGASAPADRVKGSRLIRIAKEMVDMGFAFPADVVSLVDSCVPHDPTVMALISKIVCIYGGRGEVGWPLRRYDKKRVARRNVFLVYCVYKFAIVASRARKRTLAPGNIHVDALSSNVVAH
jgi:hypothetical protein